MRRIASAVLPIALLAGGAPARADDVSPRLELSVDLPASGELALLSGRLELPDARPVDRMLAIDTSHSTSARDAEPRGWRRWLAWLLPRPRPAPTAGALAAEIARALDVLDALDPRVDRAGVVALAGDLDPRTPDALLAAPLGDLDSARAALRALLARGSRGTTNLIDAVDLARAELGRARPGARRSLLLLTDGVDVHPLHPDPAEARALLEAAVGRAATTGIDVEVHALGPNHAIEMLAGSTSNSGLDVAEVEVRNAGSGNEATETNVSAAGFAALVALTPGTNALEVCARTRSGLEIRRELEVRWDPALSAPARDPARLRAHNALLAAHLRALRARPSHRLEIEAASASH